MISTWKRKENHVRKILSERFNVNFKERKVPLLGSTKGYKFDLVSPDASVVGEIKTQVYSMPSGRIPYAKIAHVSEACLLLINAKDAKRRLLVFTDREFYEEYKKTRQGQIVEFNGIELILIE